MAVMWKRIKLEKWHARQAGVYFTDDQWVDWYKKKMKDKEAAREAKEAEWQKWEAEWAEWEESGRYEKRTENLNDGGATIKPNANEGGESQSQVSEARSRLQSAHKALAHDGAQLR